MQMHIARVLMASRACITNVCSVAISIRVCVASCEDSKIIVVAEKKGCGHG